MYGQTKKRQELTEIKKTSGSILGLFFSAVGFYQENNRLWSRVSDSLGNH